MKPLTNHGPAPHQSRQGSLGTRLIHLLVILAFSPTGYAQPSGKVFPGADEKTPSRSEYFTWINNTGEGSTEAQTLVNLDFFQWLRDEYGMIVDIYAFDAGNLEKSINLGKPGPTKFKHQFPRDYGPVAEKAAGLGTRLGVWDGPDGFGNTPAEEQQKIDLMISLCRDYHFALFKLNSMGGNLRNDKQAAFVRMMTACRSYCPDLIVLNHRLNLGPAALPHATTWLLGGEETYIDVHLANRSNGEPSSGGRAGPRVGAGPATPDGGPRGVPFIVP